MLWKLKTSSSSRFSARSSFWLSGHKWSSVLTSMLGLLLDFDFCLASLSSSSLLESELLLLSSQTWEVGLPISERPSLTALDDGLPTLDFPFDAAAVVLEAIVEFAFAVLFFLSVNLDLDLGLDLDLDLDLIGTDVLSSSEVHSEEDPGC